MTVHRYDEVLHLLSHLQSLLAGSGPLWPRLVHSWNYIVRTVFLTLSGEGGLQSETLSSLKVGLKRWGSEIKKTVISEEKTR